VGVATILSIGPAAGRSPIDSQLDDITAFSWKRGQFAAVFNDVTARREAEERLRLQAAALEVAAHEDPGRPIHEKGKP